jgi:hypothetical protein
MRETRPFFAIITKQTGLESKDCLPLRGLKLAPFLWAAEWQSGFGGLPAVNAMRSQTDDEAKPA